MTSIDETRITDAEIGDELATIIARELERQKINLTKETALEDIPGLDSVSIVGVAIEIENRFGTSLDRNGLAGLRTAGDLMAMIQAGRKQG